MTNLREQKGFTLVELMVAVAIVGIIATIAIPYVQDYLRHSKRADASSALIQLSQAMQRYYTENNTYLGAAVSGNDTGIPASSTFAYSQSPFSGNPAYNLRISAATASTYTLSAIPTGEQAGDVCGTLTLTSKNVRGHGASGSTECWR